MHFNIHPRQAAQRTLAVIILAWATPWLSADSQISIDTSAYAGLSADVLFDLTNGGGPPANAITISNFTGSEVIFSSEDQGAVSGSLPTSATLSDSAFFSEAGLDVVLGTTLTFDFAATDVAPVAGAAPDEFAFYILGFNSNQTLLPSDDPTGAESLLTIDLVGGSSPDVTIYSDLVTTGPVPQAPPVSAAPEPPDALLLGALLLLPMALRRIGARMRRCLPATGAMVAFAALSLVCLPTAQGQDIVTGVGQDPNFSVAFSGFRLNRTTNTFVTIASITNNSINPIAGPFYLGITNISTPDVTLAYGGGNLQDGYPFVALNQTTAILGGQTVTTVVSFNNPDLVAFTIQARIYDAASAPPVAKLQCPQAYDAPLGLPIWGGVPAAFYYTPPTDSLGRVASCTPASGTLITQDTTVNCASSGGASLPASCSFLQTTMQNSVIVITGPPPPPPQPPFEAQLGLIPCQVMAANFAPGQPLPTDINPFSYCYPNFFLPAGEAQFTIWNYGPSAAINSSITLSFGPFINRQAWQFSQPSTCNPPVQVAYPYSIVIDGEPILGGTRYGFNETCSFANIPPNTGVNVTVGIDVDQGEEAPDIQASIAVDPTQNTDPDTGDMAIAIPVSTGPQSVTVPVSVSERITQQNGCDFSNEPGFAILLNTCGVPTAVTTGLVSGFLGAATLITGIGEGGIVLDLIDTNENIIFNTAPDVDVLGR